MIPYGPSGKDIGIFIALVMAISVGIGAVVTRCSWDTLPDAGGLVCVSYRAKPGVECAPGTELKGDACECAQEQEQ